MRRLDTSDQRSLEAMQRDTTYALGRYQGSGEQTHLDNLLMSGKVISAGWPMYGSVERLEAINEFSFKIVYKSGKEETALVSTALLKSGILPEHCPTLPDVFEDCDDLDYSPFGEDYEDCSCKDDYPDDDDEDLAYHLRY